MDMNLSDRFERLGLTKYQAAALAAVVQGGRMPVKEISQKARIPITKVYGTMNELELIQAVRVERTRPKRYFVESAKRAVIALLARQKGKLDEAEECAEEALTIAELSGLNGSLFEENGGEIVA